MLGTLISPLTLISQLMYFVKIVGDETQTPGKLIACFCRKCNVINVLRLFLDRKGLLYAGQDFLYVQLGTKV
jgi:hypothetical protein